MKEYNNNPKGSMEKIQKSYNNNDENDDESGNVVNVVVKEEGKFHLLYFEIFVIGLNHISCL